MKSFFKKRKSSITFEKKNKRNKQRKRRNFIEIFCFVNIVSIFQRESTENMRTIRKTIFIEFINDVNVLTYNTNTKKNCTKFLKRDFDVMKSHFFFTKYELVYFNKSSKKFNMKTIINLKKMCLIFKTDIQILKLQISTKLK